jgi:isopenicillin N synthase-like dioxygenase
VAAIIERGEGLPCLDVGAFLAGEPGALEQIAADVRCIQEGLGFYVITNYGIDPSVIQNALDRSFDLFHLPESDVQPYRHDQNMQGYWPSEALMNIRPGFEHEYLGVSPHSDHSFLTLLPIAPVPGLQVRTPKNTWASVAYVPDGLVVNTGEWLNRKSGGQFIATPHRVAEPTQERISMPVFINPRDDATSEPVPTAPKDGPVSVYPTVAWHEFFCSFVGGYAK